MTKFIAALMGAAVLLAPTATLAAPKAAPLTPMQLQAIQTKEFEADKPTIFSSVVAVFQDLGYTLNTADVNTGFITAESVTENKTSFLEAFAEMASSGNTRATAFVESMPSGLTRLRLNFVSTKTMTGAGRAMRQDKPILDPKVYQTAFEKIDEALFVRKATNAPTPAAAPAPPASPPTAPAAPSA